MRSKFLALPVLLAGLIAVAPTAHALSTTGWTGDGAWFACSKAKTQATKSATDTCINQNQELNATDYSDCYPANWISHDDDETIYTRGYAVDLTFNCK